MASLQPGTLVPAEMGDCAFHVRKPANSGHGPLNGRTTFLAVIGSAGCNFIDSAMLDSLLSVSKLFHVVIRTENDARWVRSISDPPQLIQTWTVCSNRFNRVEGQAS